MWITLIKLLYAPLRWSLTTTSIHARERLCTPLLPKVRRVSEKNSSRKLGGPPYERKLFVTRTYDGAMSCAAHVLETAAFFSRLLSSTVRH